MKIPLFYRFHPKMKNVELWRKMTVYYFEKLIYQWQECWYFYFFILYILAPSIFGMGKNIPSLNLPNFLCSIDERERKNFLNNFFFNWYSIAPSILKSEKFFKKILFSFLLFHIEFGQKYIKGLKFTRFKNFIDDYIWKNILVNFLHLVLHSPFNIEIRQKYIGLKFTWFFKFYRWLKLNKIFCKCFSCRTS